MSFYFVCPGLDFTIEIPLSPLGHEQVLRQVLRAQADGDCTKFRSRLAEELGRILPNVTDWDIRPPTGAQLAYAKSLCNQLGCVLPRAVLVSRYSMQAFISEQALLLKAKK